MQNKTTGNLNSLFENTDTNSGEDATGTVIQLWKES